MTDRGLRITPPLYLVGMKVDCWKCYGRMPVVTLLALHVDGTENEVCLLSDMVDLPQDILSYIKSRVPTFQLKYSKTIGSQYYGNVCPRCGVLYGDFYLHGEPGDPFFPIDEAQARCLYLTPIPVLEPVWIQAGFSVGVGELILANAKRIN